MIDIDALFPLRSPAMTAALNAAPRHLLAANAQLSYWLGKAHYLALASIDQGRTNEGTTPLLTELVGLGALLEYNAGSWRQTHPVVRTLAGYDAATRASRASPLVAEAL